MRGKCARSAEAKRQSSEQVLINDLKRQVSEARSEAKRAQVAEQRLNRANQELALLQRQLEEAAVTHRAVYIAELQREQERHDQFSRVAIGEFTKLWNEFPNNSLFSGGFVSAVCAEAERLGIEVDAGGERWLRRLMSQPEKFDAHIGNIVQERGTAYRLRHNIVARRMAENEETRQALLAKGYIEEETA